MNDDEMPDSDIELGRRLADALRAEADAFEASNDAWARLERRLGPDGAAEAADGADAADGAEAGDGDGPVDRDVGPAVVRFPASAGSASPAASSRGSWRIPMIAAAAVVTIAVVAAVLVTRRGGHEATSSPAVACDSAASATVPVDLSGGRQAGNAGGVAAPSPTGNSASRDQPEPSSSSGSAPASPVTAFTFGFSGSPAVGPLCVAEKSGSGAERMAPTGMAGDGTPLAYLAPLRIAAAEYLVAAVGPGVSQVQIQAMPGAGVTGTRAPPTTEVDPGFTMVSHLWTIDGGQGTPWSLPEAATTVWTDLGSGWHGFALLLPSGAGTAEVSALDRRGLNVQVRTLDLATGRAVDGPTLTATTTFVPGTTTGPEASSPVEGSGSSGGSTPSSSALGSTPSSSVLGPASASTGAGPAGCAGRHGAGVGITDVGFGLATVEFGLDSDGGLCFLGGLGQDWSHALPRAGAITNAAMTDPGTFVDQVTGEQSRGRLVWGAVDSSVAEVVATAAGGQTRDQVGGLTNLTTGIRVFLIRVPVSGAVTVIATNGGGATLGTLTLR